MIPLTEEQKRKVRSLVEDEGETVRAAVAWVRAFEPAKPMCEVCGMDLTPPGDCWLENIRAADNKAAKRAFDAAKGRGE